MMRRSTVLVPIPEPTIPQPRPRHARTRFLLTGADGSTWDLTNGPIRLGRGVKGLMPPDAQHQWRTASKIDGAVHRGHQFTGPQDITLPVQVTATPGLGWRDLDGMLWEALRPDVECRITAVSPDNVARWRSVWFVGVGDDEYDTDPLVLGHARYPLGFQAPDPYWRGAYEPVGFTPDPNFPAVWDHAGGVMNLAPAQAAAATVLRNAGDVPSWPTVAAAGPMDGFLVGVGDSVFEYGPVAANRAVFVDMHPSMQTVGHAVGANSETAWAGVKRRKFTPIPPKSESDMQLEVRNMSTGGSLVVEVPQLFYRPFGFIR